MEAIAAINQIVYGEDIPNKEKIVRLYAMAMLYYRREEGEEACRQIRLLVGEDASLALFYLTGFVQRRPDPDWNRLLPEAHHQFPE